MVVLLVDTSLALAGTPYRSTAWVMALSWASGRRRTLYVVVGRCLHNANRDLILVAPRIGLHPRPQRLPVRAGAVVVGAL